MAPRGALYLMPSLAVLAVAVLVLGPGRERPAIGARVWGVPAAGARKAVWRLETIERQYGADQVIAVDALDLQVFEGLSLLARWGGATAEDGVAEATIDAGKPFPSGVLVQVRHGKTLLAQGTIQMQAVPPPAFEPRRVEGTAKGPVALRVEIGRGILAAPFPGTLFVHASKDGKAAAGVVLKPTAAGAQVLEMGLMASTDSNGEAKIHLQPTWHSVDLQIEATDPTADPPTKSTWDGSLPVKPGALWLSIEPSKTTVISPAPRDRAYVSGLGERGRVLGAVVPLTKNASGLFEGDLPHDLAKLGVRAVTVAGDVQELGAATVTWPVEGNDAVAAAPRVELMLDGVPLAERLEKARAASARLASVGVALVAGLFEAVLLVLYSRASQAKLAAHLAQASEDAEGLAAAARMTASPSSRIFTLVVAVGLVVLAFGAIAAFAIVR